MSHDSIELIRALFDGFRRDGPKGVLAYLAKDVEWAVRPDLPDATTYRGHVGVRQLLKNFEDVMDDQWYSPVDFIVSENTVVVTLNWGGRGRVSGVPFTEHQETWVFYVRGGKVNRVVEYATKPEALKATGLSD